MILDGNLVENLDHVDHLATLEVCLSPLESNHNITRLADMLAIHDCMVEMLFAIAFKPSQRNGKDSGEETRISMALWI